MQRKCDLRQLGGLLDSKGYAIAMPKNSPYSATISQGVIRLIEKVFIPPRIIYIKWNDDLNNAIDEDYWEICFIQIHKCTISAKLRAFQYRFIHRIIYTNSKLFKCGIKESAICSLCNEEEETFIHYFYELLSFI